MKNSLSVLFLLIPLLIGTLACKMDTSIASSPSDEDNNGNATDTVGGQLKITVGSATFTATLLNNATVTAFKARLPMTVSMSELNGNEKLYNFPAGLPTNAVNPGTIQTGDLMLYGSNTLVLFYKTFPTPYSYTRLGRISNPAGLEAALGAGSTTVTFALE